MCFVLVKQDIHHIHRTFIFHDPTVILLFMCSTVHRFSPIAQGDEIFASMPSVCVSFCGLCVFLCQCQHCCSEQKSCQEVRKVRSGSNLRPAKTDKPQQQSCQDASFGTAVTQHTSPEPDMGHSCRSAWAHKSDASTIWTAAVLQESASASL